MVVTDVQPSDAWARYMKDKEVVCFYGDEDQRYRICQ